MPYSIGLRVYQIALRDKDTGEARNFCGDGGPLDLFAFTQAFIEARKAVTKNTERQRSWYFHRRTENAPPQLCGLIQYGTFGFQSDLIDAETGEINYTRKIDEIEEIPLFFMFSIGENRDSALAAFQNFGSRSCIQMVLDELKREYETSTDKYFMTIQKLMPAEIIQNTYKNEPVKQITLLKRQDSDDIADTYWRRASPSSQKIKLSITATRGGSLGLLNELIPRTDEHRTSLLSYAGIEFEAAKAEVMIAGKRRTVGLVGFDQNSGAIDITDQIIFGPNGHPTFDSILAEANDIVDSFDDRLHGSDHED